MENGWIDTLETRGKWTDKCHPDPKSKKKGYNDQKAKCLLNETHSNLRPSCFAAGENVRLSVELGWTFIPVFLLSWQKCNTNEIKA